MDGLDIHIHTESRVLHGTLANSRPRACLQTYPENRVCTAEGCTTTLSIYNGGDSCWQHEALRPFVHRAQRRGGSAAA